ncbi:MAG TPA: penicillin-binding protein 2 [Aquihabitans sp.]|jgi:cell division protein FtsI (penicillin-binding protein 3)|nr:penicillin-binding protein 2 [Aquihabitans sp.]
MTERLDFDDLDDFFARPRATRSATTTTTTRRPAPARPAGRAARGRSAAPARRIPPPAPTRRDPARPVARQRLAPPTTAITGGAVGTARTADRTRPPAGRRPVAPPRPPRPPRAPRPRPLPVDGEVARQRTRRRLIGFVVVVMVLGGGIVVRLGDLQLTGGAACRTLSVADCKAYGAGQRKAFRPIPAGRGGIYDRNGQAFALSVPEPNVVADPASIEDPLATARALSPVLDVPAGELAERLATPDSRYQLLATTVTPTIEEEVRALRLEGISFEEQYVRKNPSDGLARAVVGDTYDEGRVDERGRQGQTGVELAYDDQLQGTGGRVSFEKAPGGGTIAGTREKVQAAKPGTDLYLTLDQSLQYAAEQAVEDQVRATRAKQGIAIISRPSTGEILAMVSVADDGEGNVVSTGDNRPVTSVFEPGSVNKMITVAGAMEEGLIDADTTFQVPDSLQVADHAFTDHDPHPTALWSTTDILVTSSNIGTIKIAQQLGAEKVDEYLRAFGFGESTSTDFPGEVDGLMLPLEEWSGTSIGAIPIGQGISVTALQMLAAYNVIANDGVYVPPRLVSATDDGEGKVPTSASGHRRVVSEGTARAMSAMLEKVVADGTGQPAQVPGYPAAGKTGTARIPQPGPHADPTDAYQDEQGRYHYESSFVGFVAGTDLSIIVTIQDAETSIYGSEVAAPVFSQLASLALRSEQIPPPSLAGARGDVVPELSPSARRIEGEDPGLVTQTTQD